MREVIANNAIIANVIFILKLMYLFMNKEQDIAQGRSSKFCLGLLGIYGIEEKTYNFQ